MHSPKEQHALRSVQCPRHEQKSRAGFTLVELIVSVAIFAVMTALVVAKYGNFNNNILFTNLAYDVAGIIRTAQSYGLSVRSADDVGNFQSAYGVHISTDQPKTIIFFADTDEDGIYGGSSEDISFYALKQGAYIVGYCFVPSCQGYANGDLNITFKRPDPDARLYDSEFLIGNYAEIVIQSPQGDTRAIVVRGNGQISIKD